MRIYDIPDPLYRRGFKLIIGNQKEFMKFMSEKYKYEMEVTSAHAGIFDSIVSEDGRSEYIIWIKKFENTAEDIAVLSHEILHYTFQALKDVGMRYNNGSEEAYTYYFQQMLESSLNTRIR